VLFIQSLEQLEAPGSGHDSVDPDQWGEIGLQICDAGLDQGLP
jgi:hypothetical protein